MYSALPFLFFIMLIPYVAPFVVDPFMRRRIGYEHPYKWGYFLGLYFLLIGAMHFVMAPMFLSSFEEGQIGRANDFFFGGLRFEWLFLAQGILATVIGFGIVFRRRWGWVLFLTTLIIAPVAAIPLFFGMLDQSVPEMSAGDTPPSVYIALALVSLQYWVIAGLHIPYVKRRWSELAKRA